MAFAIFAFAKIAQKHEVEYKITNLNVFAETGLTSHEAVGT